MPYNVHTYPSTYDPLVLAHARALLTSTPAGRTAYIEADLREPEKILANPVVRDTLDFSEELVPPEVVLTSEWRPTGAGPRATPEEVNAYGAVARKPG